jgi:EEF1A lysine methyltransferase 2
MVEPNGDDYQSKLSKHEYWESNFELELKNFEDHGDDGEVWFGKDVQKKTVEYLLGRFSDKENLKVLDVGTGNGALLFKLAKKGFQGELKGIDYSVQSIALAKKIHEVSHAEKTQVVFEF